jgi:hypothetical protein
VEAAKVTPPAKTLVDNAVARITNEAAAQNRKCPTPESFEFRRAEPPKAPLFLSMTSIPLPQ